MIIIHGMKTDAGYLPRIQEPVLAAALKSHPVVVLHGARQTGKSTLACSPSISRGRTYRTLDDFDDLDLADTNPSALLLAGDLVTLDEVQRKPKLLLAVKRDVDRARKPGRFLLTGSANILLMKEVSETLAGRAVYIRLPPMVRGEIEGGASGTCLDGLLESDDSRSAIARLPAGGPHPDLAGEILRGGYPVPALMQDHAMRASWFDGYIQTYLERDLRGVSAVQELADFRRVMKFAALRTATLLNQANLARDAGVSSATAHRYLAILEATFQIHRIPAFSRIRNRRLIKAPKLYWNDTGLAARIAGFSTADEISESHEWGAWVENYAATHLLAFAEMASPQMGISHWRTAAGQEVDFVVESRGRLLPIEVKAAANPNPDDARHLLAFLDEYPETRIGVLACACRKPVPISPSVLAIPLGTLLS